MRQFFIVSKNSLAIIDMDIKGEKIKGLMKLKMAITKLQRRREDGEEESAANLPNDVKKGHIAVVAVKGGEPKRFIVELGILKNPKFLSLLKLAEEEYGFYQKGVLKIPCLPEELEDVLHHMKHIKVRT